MKILILHVCIVLALLLPAANLDAQTATYDVTTPDIATSGSFTGNLTYGGLKVSPYVSATRTVNNITKNLDTMNQKISGSQHSVTTQFTYTQTSGTSYGSVVYTEASIDSGTAVNYVTLYADSVKTIVGAQVFGHVIAGWPYSNIRMRWKGTGTYAGNWKGQLLIR